MHKSDKAIISEWVDDNAMTFWNWDFQKIGPPNIVTNAPLRDFADEGSPAQSASAYDCGVSCLIIDEEDEAEKWGPKLGFSFILFK